jgi:hypothetical protein
VNPTRRRFLNHAASLALAVVAWFHKPSRYCFGSQAEPAPIPAMTLAEALEKGQKLGIGSAILAGPTSAEVKSYGTWTVVYTAGQAGIKPGGGIRVGVRHMNHHWTPLQDRDPSADGFVRVRTSGKAPLSTLVECTNWSPKFFVDYFPVHNIVEVKVGEPGLIPGETLSICYGDRSGGSKGMLLQPFDESHYDFSTFVDALGNGEYLPLTDRPSLRIEPGEAVRLAVIARSDGVVGKPVRCLVRAEDRYGNPARRYQGLVRLQADGSLTSCPPPYQFTESDGGAHVFDGVVFGSEGVFSLSATDGVFRAESNPVRVRASPPERALLWGDLHGHTVFSDGRGTVQEYYDFARQAAGLDFCAVSDHAFEMPEALWTECKAVTNRNNRDGEFVTFNAYEWSGASKVGGDHNVYWLDDDPPIFRSISYYSPRNLQMEHSQESKVPHIQGLYAKVRPYLKDKNVLCIPHRGGRPANPEWHDPQIERLVESYCEHFRSVDWANGFLQKGYRLGVMGSGDGHYGHPGYGYLRPDKQHQIGEGLIAVLAEEHTRRSIFTALFDRHCYATSGDRIILDFRVDNHLMGAEYRTDKPPELKVTVHGTSEVSRVEILRNSIPVHVSTPGTKNVELSWTDAGFDPRSGSGYHYQVRVVQANNEEALSSPVWVN